MKTKCSTCNGIYAAIGADGLPYFHRCSPLRRLRVLELDGTYSTVAPGTEGVRPVVGERTVDRPNFRDENVAWNPATKQYEPIALGTGVTQVPDNAML